MFFFFLSEYMCRFVQSVSWHQVGTKDDLLVVINFCFRQDIPVVFKYTSTEYYSAEQPPLAFYFVFTVFLFKVLYED